MHTSSDDRSGFSKLPPDRTFGQLLVPFLAPYVLYTGLASLFPAASGQAWLQGVKLAAVGLALAAFWKQYRFGRLQARHFWLAGLAAPCATLLWVGPACAWQIFVRGMPPAAAGHISAAGFGLRLVNSVLLVAVFEELLLRVYFMEWAFQADANRRAQGTLPTGSRGGSGGTARPCADCPPAGRGRRSFFQALVETLDEKPAPCTGLPLSLASVAFTTVLFTAGHAFSEYPSAVLYFSFTNWVYRRTGSLWVCILIHAWTNLLIALLVQFGGMRFLW